MVCGGYFEGVSRVIYCSLYVGIVFRSLINFLRLIKIQRNYISTSVSHLLIHHEDSVYNHPQMLECWDSQLSSCVISFGCLTDLLVNTRHHSWAFVLEYYFWSNHQKNQWRIIRSVENRPLQKSPQTSKTPVSQILMGSCGCVAYDLLKKSIKQELLPS
jgi:hypothetical protein